MEITVSVTIEGVIFSFKTDSEGKQISEGIEAIRKIYEGHKVEFSRLGIEVRASSAATAKYVEKLSIKDLSIPEDKLKLIVSKINKVSNWDILLVMLCFSKTPLTYDDIMRLSEELGKPIQYSWLDTSFHRRRDEGLVQAVDIPDSKKKAYKLTESGKGKAEEILDELGSA